MIFADKHPNFMSTFPGTVKTSRRFVDSSNKDVCNNCTCHCLQLDSALNTLSPARSQVATVKKCYGLCTQEDCLPNNAACVDKESGLQLSHQCLQYLKSEWFKDLCKLNFLSVMAF